LLYSQILLLIELLNLLYTYIKDCSIQNKLYSILINVSYKYTSVTFQSNVLNFVDIKRKVPLL